MGCTYTSRYKTQTQWDQQMLIQMLDQQNQPNLHIKT